MIQYFEPDTTEKQTLTVTTMRPSDPKWFPLILNGVFEGANQADFSDAEMLYRITEIPGDFFSHAKIKNTKSFRYVRYVPPPEAHCNMAEIRIFDKDGSAITGQPIGTSRTWPAHLKMTHDKSFDGDVTTYFDALDNDSWTGLDMETPHRIGEIHYLPRNEGQLGIYEGHEYELFYWDRDGWRSLGKKIANSNQLIYRSVPSNALMRMKNLTVGNYGILLFVAEKGRQRWLL